MPNTWNLICGSANQTAAAWGVSGIKRQRRAGEVSTVTFTASGRACDAAPLFAPKATVSIFYGGILWFVGRVTKIPVAGSSKAENQEYELSDAWWYLDNLVCRQQWYVGGNTVTALSTRLILGQALTGANITTGQVILETLQYAINAGAPLEIGTIDPAMLIPLIEVKDVTCADVVKQMLHWHPDCVAFFDYTTTPYPTLHIRARANLTAVLLPLGQPPFSAAGELTPRFELQPAGVMIIYEQTGNDNGTPTFHLVPDAFPAGTTGQEFGSVVCTIPLRGPSITTVQQRVVTQGISGANADGSAPNWSDPDLLTYLASFNADLQAAIDDPNITAAGITLQAATDSSGNTLPYRSLVGSSLDPSSLPNAAPTPVGQVFDPTLLNELVEGSITDWMRTGYAVKAQQQRMTFAYTKDSGDGSAGDTSISAPLTAHVERLATNAGTGQALASQYYQSVSSFSSGDAVPVGIAEAYYNSLAVLEYSGTVTLIEGEVSGVAGLGQLLNLIGSANAAWSTMNARIQAESIDVDAGTTSLTLGPPEHLSPQDLVERLRIARPSTIGGRSPDSPSVGATDNSGTRTSGSPTAAGTVSLGVTQPIQNSYPAPGGGSLLWCQLPVSGQIAYSNVDMTTPVTTLPDGAQVVNPD